MERAHRLTLRLNSCVIKTSDGYCEYYCIKDFNSAFLKEADRDWCTLRLAVCPGPSDRVYSPVTRTSLWISSLRHLRWLGDRWNMTASTWTTTTTNSAAVDRSINDSTLILSDGKLEEHLEEHSHFYSSCFFNNYIKRGTKTTSGDQLPTSRRQVEPDGSDSTTYRNNE